MSQWFCLSLLSYCEFRDSTNFFLIIGFLFGQLWVQVLFLYISLRFLAFYNLLYHCVVFDHMHTWVLAHVCHSTRVEVREQLLSTISPLRQWVLGNIGYQVCTASIVTCWAILVAHGCLTFKNSSYKPFRKCYFFSIEEIKCLAWAHKST